MRYLSQLKIGVVICFFVMVGVVLSQPQKKMWPPNKVPANVHYEGVQACAECHADKVKSYLQTMMGQALEPIADAVILKKNPRLTFQSGPYLYEIVRQGNESIFKVTRGTETLAVPILFSFGQGHAGQTYVLRYKGNLYEGRVSYYNEINGLDFTIGASREVPTSLEDAIGRPTPHDESVQCFSCHSAGAAMGGKLNLDKIIPGIGCEICHGPGGEHIALGKKGEPNENKIFNPGRLSSDELSQEFCASCHRGAEDLFAMPKQGGLNNVRFQPYRIFNSKCYSDDKRIACTACHDAHKPMSRDAGSYDSKCAACHNPKEPQAKLCKTGTNNCVTCHMPKIELPGAHYKFADHRIRIYKPNEPYPY